MYSDTLIEACVVFTLVICAFFLHRVSSRIHLLQKYKSLRLLYSGLIAGCVSDVVAQLSVDDVHASFMLPLFLSSVPLVIIAVYADFLTTMVAALIACVSTVVFHSEFAWIYVPSLLLASAVSFALCQSRLVPQHLKVIVCNVVFLLQQSIVTFQSGGPVILAPSYIIQHGHVHSFLQLPYVLMVSFVVGVAACLLVDLLHRHFRLYDDLYRLSTTDYLTGLSNTRRFHEAFDHALQQVEDFQTTVSVLMIDVDNFKTLNDSYGHPAGDAVLQEIARILKGCTRETDTVARYGGEEFSVILPDANAREACEIANRICRTVEEHAFLVERVRVHMTVSIGVSTIDEIDAPALELIRRADDSLYHAKRSGKNRVVFDGQHLMV